MNKFLCNSKDTVVSTDKGLLRGFLYNDIYTFQGIKYADAKRFQMPEEVEAWEGIKDAMSYGYVCPLLQQEHPAAEVMVPHQYWPMDEDCQYLNIWTPSLQSGAKKAVMVWLHGGGFWAGSSIEQLAYHGENLAKHEDVIVVSLNHRLNILGYLDLSPFGDKYAHSANVGNDDIIAALKWINTNIAAFGGDPDNVTLFGQSGGGMKVTCMMQMPAAYGLFSKGIIQSGVVGDLMKEIEDDGRAIVTAMMEELGLKPDQVEELETLPYQDLAQAYNKVSPGLAKEGHYIGCTPLKNDFYMGDPVIHGFTDYAKTIPLIVGSTMAEFAFGPAIKGRVTMDETHKVEIIEDKFGQGAGPVMDAFKEAYPDKEILSLLEFDSMVRGATKDYILKKAGVDKSATYSYVFALDFEIEEGKSAWHCSDIPYVFHNMDKVPIANVEEAGAYVEKVMSRAWASFAKDGKPDTGQGLVWEPSTGAEEHTMIFDKACRTGINFDHDLINLHKKHGPAFVFGGQEVQH